MAMITDDSSSLFEVAVGYAQEMLWKYNALTLAVDTDCDLSLIHIKQK